MNNDKHDKKDNNNIQLNVLNDKKDNITQIKKSVSNDNEHLSIHSFYINVNNENANNNQLDSPLDESKGKNNDDVKENSASAVVNENQIAEKDITNESTNEVTTSHNTNIPSVPIVNAVTNELNNQIHDTVTNKPSTSISWPEQPIVTPRRTIASLIPGITPKIHPEEINNNTTIDIDMTLLSNKHNNVVDEENLGINFESTTWLPPTIEKAKEFKINNLFMSGQGRLLSTSVIDAPGLSVGVCSYFLFMKYISIYMCLSIILMIPMLIFTYYGSNVPTQQQDSLGFYRFTLGNIGNDSNTTYNTKLTIFLNIIFTIEQVSYIIVVCEMLQCLLYLLIIRLLYNKINDIEAKLFQSTCSITNYSIMIRNLPKDCSKQELIDYFNELYPLDKPDWSNRPGLLHTKPLVNNANTLDPIYINTWIAECFIYKAIGNLLRTFKQQQIIIDKLFRYRALMKVYSVTNISVHRYKNNSKKYLQSKKVIDRLDNQIRSLTMRLLYSTKVKIDNLNTTLMKQMEEENSAFIHQDTTQYFDSNVEAGFLTFQYNESMVRCIHDNKNYNRLPYVIFNYPWYYPKKLLFRNKHILSIRQASEPDEIIWENLEGRLSIKLIQRFRTFIITIILIIFCFFIILQSTVYKDKFNRLLPNLNYCNNIIPSVYNNQTSRSSSFISSLTWNQLDNNNLNKQCNDINSNSFYAVYTISSSKIPAVNYNIDSCNKTNICPVYNAHSYCPCVSTSLSTTCYSKDCTLNGYTDSNCITYTAGTIGSCFCYNQLINILKSKSLIDLANKIKQQQSSNECTNFFINYSTSSLVSYVAIFATVVINRILLYIFNYLTNQEYYTSIDKLQTSLLYKIFISTYFNLAILIVLASGKLGSNQATSRKYVSYIHIFQGIYPDFNVDWYGNVGTYFIMSFMLQGMAYIVITFVDYMIYKPLMRIIIYPFVRSKSSEYVVRQKELNEMELGQSFDPTENQSQLIALLFFGMTYAGGIPLIAPLAAVVFILHFMIEKLLLLRYTIKPLKLGKSLSDATIVLLPFAVYIRLAISCWMYSYHTILTTKYDTVTSSSTPGLTREFYKYILETISSYISEHAPLLKHVVKRLIVPHVFPLILLLVVLIVIHIVYNIFVNLPIYWMSKYLYDKTIGDYKKRRQISDIRIVLKNNLIDPIDLKRLNHPLRKESAGLTNEYYQYVNKANTLTSCCKSKSILKQIDISNGWEVKAIDNHEIKLKRWLHNHHDPLTNLPVNKGDVKLTYEIIREHGCCSYLIDRIPSYELPIEGLKQSIHTIIRKHQKTLHDSSLKFHETFNGQQPIKEDIPN